MRLLAPVCLLFAACGPVLLVDGDSAGDSNAPPMGGEGSATAGTGAGAGGGGTGSSAVAEPGPNDDDAPRGLITVKPVDCGRCFELVASGAGGLPPYIFEWEDGSQGAQRRVCPNAAVEVSVVVEDTDGARSDAYVTRLEGDASAMCAPPPAPAPQICITNPSFDGVPIFNMGDDFDAPPWSDCTNPSVPNTPDIGSVEVAQTEMLSPTDGDTFLGLGIGEQASQQLCETMQAGAHLSFEIDLARVNVTTGVVPPTGNVFLEIYGGVAADCVQRRLLWASPPLDVGWKRHCVELHPAEFMDHITLRASSNDQTLTLSYVLADHLVPVDGCP